MQNLMLLVACISITLALVLYLFYWNRFVAYMAGLIIRLMYWNQADSRIWVEIGSIHFSLLAGRILLKDIRYHSSNQTITMVKGQITWRYWIRKPTIEQVNQARIAEKPALRASNCRVHVSVQGFETFLYNRTASYDNIVSQVQPNGLTRPTFQSQQGEPEYAAAHSWQKSPLPAASVSPLPPALPPGSIGRGTIIRTVISWITRQWPNLDPKDLLPVGIEITQGSIICGNPSTPTFLITEFQKAEGTFGIMQSRSKYDFRKQILTLEFRHALVRYAPNDDYRGSMTAIGEMVDRHINASLSESRWLHYLSFPVFTKLWKHLGLYAVIQRRFSSVVGHGTSLRMGATRILEEPPNIVHEEIPISEDISTLEYAIEHKILETPVLEISYYADVAGDVPPFQDQIGPVMLEPFDIGNGDLPPEWGVHIVVRGGLLHYGPWADRQRLELQRAFFPPPYQDIEPASFLRPGDKRVWTCFKVFVELRDDTVLRIPFRETSKNWQWDGEVDFQHLRKREPASIHITAGDSSSISYIMPLVAGPMGYEPLLEVHLDTVVVSSSLNDIRLVTAESCRFSGVLRSPLKWNVEREWTFSVSLRQPVLYLIRDHINMFTDLTRDWTSGPPTDYHRFIPTLYVIQLDMHHFEIFLYANDHNIIDKPLTKDENALFALRGAHFRHQMRIPANKFRPETTSILFNAEAPDILLTLSLPRWNTHALHAPKQGNSICKAALFRLDGSFRYFSEVREDHVEHLKLDFSARDVAFKALGWSIRYFMVLRDNYFGSFTHFSTLYEYLDKRRKGLSVGDPIAEKYRPGKANMLETVLGLSLENGLLILPAGLPGYESSNSGQVSDDIGTCISIIIPELQVQLRLHDYFMEMSLNIDSASGHVSQFHPEELSHSNSGNQWSKESIVIDGIDITANRLFGPQPRTSTYVCIWTVHVGHVKTLLPVSASRILLATYNAFRLSFTDPLNAPSSDYILPLDPDITFMKCSVNALDTIWIAGHAALELSFPRGFNFESNDLGGKFHRTFSSLRLPHASAKIYLSANSQRRTWMEVAELSTDAYLDIYSSPPGWKNKARAQVEFVRAQDAPTGRVQWMFDTFSFRHPLHMNGLFLPRPQLFYPEIPVEVVSRSTSPRPPTIRTASRPHPRSLRSHSSESEGGEGVSEAHRDACLAKTRSIAPVVSSVDDDNQSMSSGDESDDEDLTDAYISESEYSDFLHDTYRNGSPSLLTRYSHSTRHYTAPFLNFPWQWDGTPFLLIRDCKHSTPIAGRVRSGSTNAWGNSFALNSIIPVSECGMPSIAIRLESRQGLELRVTPLVPLVATIFAEDISANLLSPELSLDAIVEGYLTADSQKKTITFQVALSSARIRIIHNIPVVGEDGPLLSPLTPGRLDHCQRDVTATIDIVSDCCRLVWSSMDPNPPSYTNLTLSTSFHGMSIMLGIASDKQPGANFEANVFQLDLHQFQSIFTPDKLDLTCDAIFTEVDHMGPEFMTVTSITLAQSQRDLLRIYKKHRADAAVFKGNMIYNILKSSSRKSIVDPLSTIQPSYLIQSGRPHQLRTDTTFKFLFHLRNCLWHLDDLERRDFFSPINFQEPVIADDAVPLLESRLMSLALDIDSSKVPDLAALGVSFPNRQIPIDQQRPTSHTLHSVSILLKKIEILARDPLGESSTQLILAQLIVAARLPILELLTSPPLQVTLSQASLRDQEPLKIQQLIASISVMDVDWTVSPHLMPFVQQMLRVRRHYHTSNDPKEPIADDESTMPKTVATMSFHLTSSFSRLRIQAAAENLIFEFRVTGARSAFTFLRSSLGSRTCDRTANVSILFDEVFFRACSPSDSTKHNEQDILASLVFNGGKANAVTRQEPSSGITVRAVLSTENLRFNVPRSALRLYRFIQEWREDFLPDIEGTLQSLLSEIQKAPAKTLSPTPRSVLRSPVFQVHGSIRAFGIALQVMHGTWLSWDVYRTTVYLRSSTTSTRDLVPHFGLQVASQTFSISSKPGISTNVAPSTRVKLDLPTLSVAGHYHESRIRTIALVDFFHAKAKPSHWDTLLVVQQKFGQDFNDLMTLVEETRRRQRSVPFPPSPRNPWKYCGSLKMRGFRIGLEGISSTIYLECKDIRGGIEQDTGRIWHIQLSDLGLSLAPRATTTCRDFGTSRSHRLAFVIIDFQTSAGTRFPRTSNSELLHISVTKIHAVMQPSSIGEVGDFIDHMQCEIFDRKEQRVLELAAFKEKTKSVMRTFEINVKDRMLEEANPTWLGKYIIILSVRNIGVAFPLTLDQDLQLPQWGSRDSSAVRAFLFSVESIDFDTQRDEGGQAKMKRFSFQFVSRFRQSVPADFSGENHQTRNRLVYPEMTARLRSNSSPVSRQIRIGANVSGFVLDLDSTIPDYIFSLIDVYHQGKERVARLTATLPRNPPTVDSKLRVGTTGMPTQYTVSTTSNVLASLTFLSGKVRVYSGAASALSKTWFQSRAVHESPDEQFSEFGAEIFELPVVSVWAEYRAALTSHNIGTGNAAEPTVLLFKSTVHSSQNSLRPILLPFLTEVVSQIDARMRRMSSRNLHFQSDNVQELPPVVGIDGDPIVDAVSSMQISFSLRIDQSRLELTCQPDVNVIAGLHWDSGGFVVNVSPGAQKVTFSGSVGGLTVGLKHGFLSEDCVRLDAHNLAFSVAFTKVEFEAGHPISSVSVVLDTEFSGEVRFSRLQDILCFKAVWLDRIPIFTGQDVALTSPAKFTSTSTSTKSQFTTGFLLRIRQIKLDVDLGQSISALTLDLRNTLVRTKLTTGLNEVALSVVDVLVIAKGNVSGNARLPNFVFQTIRRQEDKTLDAKKQPKLLELTMTSGALDVMLESDHQRLLQYHAKPLEVEIYDDWSMISPQLQVEDQSLRLSFVVSGTEIVAAVTVGTVPKLLLYANKFKTNLDAQRDGASRESKTFRVTRSPKPDNPLSAVAHAILHSARNRFKEAEAGLSYAIQQHLSLRLKLLRLAVFPRTMGDPEIAQFVGRDVHARLDRLVDSDARPAKRDLLLSISSVIISKYSQLNHVRAGSTSPCDGTTWLTLLLENAPEATIVGLPSMHMHMSSQQTFTESTRNLVYDFHSQFIRREGMRDQDIYITLNMSLYSWLTLLRRNLSREMDQVLASTDKRSSVGSSSVSLTRKKVPDTLQLAESMLSISRISSNSSISATIAPSPNVRAGSMEHSKSASPTYVSLDSGSRDLYLQSPSHSKSADTLLSPQVPFPTSSIVSGPAATTASSSVLTGESSGPRISYRPRHRHIERLTMRQLGEATPDVMHPFFMKKAGFNLEDSLPQYVHEYATLPLGTIMEMLLKLYSKQLHTNNYRSSS